MPVVNVKDDGGSSPDEPNNANEGGRRRTSGAIKREAEQAGLEVVSKEEKRKEKEQNKVQDIEEMTNKPISFRDNQGRLAAVRLPDNRVFSGLDENQLKALAEGAAGVETPRGSVEASKLRRLRQQQLEQARAGTFGAGQAETPEQIQQLQEGETERFLQQVQQERGQLQPSLSDIEGTLETRETSGNFLGELAGGSFDILSKLQDNIMGQGIQKDVMNSIASTFGMGESEIKQASMTGGDDIKQLVKSATQQKTQEKINEVSGRIMRSIGGVGGELIGANIDDVTDIITNPEDANELESRIGKKAEALTAITGTVESGGLRPTQGLAQIDKEEDELNILLTKVRTAGVLNPEIKQTGKYGNIIEEIQKTKRELKEERAKIIQIENQGVETFNEAQVTYIVDNLEKNTKIEND